MAKTPLKTKKKQKLRTSLQRAVVENKIGQSYFQNRSPQGVFLCPKVLKTSSKYKNTDESYCYCVKRIPFSGSIASIFLLLATILICHREHLNGSSTYIFIIQF